MATSSSTAELNKWYKVIKTQYDSQEALKLEEESLGLSDHELECVRGLQGWASALGTQLWSRFETLLKTSLQENSVKLVRKLRQPQSAADWAVIELLVKYVSTPSEERTNLPVPPAYLVVKPVKPASQFLNMTKNWCLDRLKACGRFGTSLFEIAARGLKRLLEFQS